jgi:hypothetical protein
MLNQQRYSGPEANPESNRAAECQVRQLGVEKPNGSGFGALAVTDCFVAGAGYRNRYPRWLQFGEEIFNS